MLDQTDTPRILKKALSRGGDFSDLYFENNFDTNIIFEDKTVKEIVSGVDQGVGLRIISNNNTIYGFSNNLDANSLDSLAEDLSSALKGKPFSQSINLKAKKPRLLFPVKIRPADIATDQKVKFLKEISELTWGLDNRVRQVTVKYTESQKQSELANSCGEFVKNSRTIVNIVIVVTVNDNNSFFSCGDIIGGHGGYELIDQTATEAMAKDLTRRALQNITAPRIKGGVMPVVLSGKAGGTIIHEAVGHGLEADIVHDGMSIFEELLGKKIASSKVTIIDDATLPQKSGSFSFDDEGTPSQKTVLVENGVLKNFLCDRLTGMKMNIPSTGNGRRESYEYKPIVRMTNTILSPGQDNVNDIIKSVNNGLFVRDMGGGQVNTVNGDFVFECTEAYLLKNGRIDQPVKNATLIGNGADVIKSIDKIGNDLALANGTCGKDDQEVPVTDGIPTIRIPEITVGGTTES